MKINKDLAMEIKRENIKLCGKGLFDLEKVKDIPTAINYFFSNIDFCLNNDFPNKEYFKKFEGLQSYGVYSDEEIMTKNRKEMIAFGSCTGEIEYTDYSVCRLFVKDASKLIIKASGNAFVMIDVFDNSEIEVSAIDSSRVKIHKYGGHVTTVFDSDSNTSMSITVTKKDTKTY
jgi:hypothetical protein